MPAKTEKHETSLDTLIARAAQTVAAIAPTLPTFDSIQAVLKANEEVNCRGYFLPDEDEQVRALFAHYLTTRAALNETLQELRPHALNELGQSKPARPELFVVSYFTACLLMRVGRFLVDSFRKQPVVWKKLDEAEPRFGIPKKQFTRVYRSLTSPRNVWVFLEASRYWRENRIELLRLEQDPVCGPVLALLLEEEPWIETSKRYYTGHQLKYRLHSFLRRNHSGFKNVTFALFQASGRVISELRWKGKRKRVTPGVQRKLARLLQPGDVLITRHDDAASNLFLPGFWPHGAFYIGTPQQRQTLGIEHPPTVENSVADQTATNQTDTDHDPICVLEARKDGVRFRPLSDTLSVDAVTVLRPQLSADQIRIGIERAMTHAGKPYDFEFDFRRTDKLVCTEVIYRAFHGCEPFKFELKPRAGRVCFSAEDLLDTAVDKNYFEVLAIYGVQGNRFATGERAKELLIASYRK